jgi:hypothetical protein
MKRIFLSALIGVGIVAAIFQIPSGGEAALVQQSYPLVCRGSANLPIGAAPGERNFGFVFTRGTRPASQGLAPGECSWTDRGMSQAEPDRISQHVDANSESLRGNLTPENRWYEELHSPDKYWTFMVSNNGQGQLIVTSARPNAKIDVFPTPRVPGPVANTGDEGAKTAGETSRSECGMTLPCGGTISQGAPAFSIVNLSGTSIRAQGGGAGLFRSAFIAKNTNESGIGIWSTTASSDANVVIANTGSGDLMRGFSGAGGGDLVFQVLNNGAMKVRSIEANTTNDAGVRGINTGAGAGVVGVSFSASGTGGSFSNTKGGAALEVKGPAYMSDVEVSVLTIKGGSDLAERFEVSDEAKPGMVVAIDADHPGMLCIARGTYNRRVAGILSGANDLGAGMVLADLPGAKHSMPLALSGRVWVYVDATSKAIEPGDFLTTAELPGYAMAVADYRRAQGSIIGKAMTGLKQGRGMVLVFVTLQ